MRKLTCIICPNGCELTIDDNMQVSGNICKRGESYALQEIKDPKRSITSTVKTSFKDIPVIACKTDGEIKKDLIFKAMEEIDKVTITKRMGIGEVVIENLLDTGINVVLCSNALKEE